MPTSPSCCACTCTTRATRSTHAADGDAGLRELERGNWDALVLDLMLPGVDGLEICRRARAMTRYTPIIITSARSSEVHRILGLELGADDYLAKPFSVLELVARVRALLRRTEAMARMRGMESGRLDLAGLRIDPIAREVQVDGSADRPHAARVRPAVFLRAPSRQGVLAARPAQPGLGLPARRLRAHGQHPHQPAAHEDRSRPGRAAPHPHRLGPRLQAGGAAGAEPT